MQTGVLLITGNISRTKETAAGGIIDQRIPSNLLKSFQKAASCKKNMCEKVVILHFVQFIVKASQCQSEYNQLSEFYFLSVLSGLYHPGVTQADLIGIFLIPKLYYRDHVRDCLE